MLWIQWCASQDRSVVLLLRVTILLKKYWILQKNHNRMFLFVGGLMGIELKLYHLGIVPVNWIRQWFLWEIQKIATKFKKRRTSCIARMFFWFVKFSIESLTINVLSFLMYLAMIKWLLLQMVQMQLSGRCLPKKNSWMRDSLSSEVKNQGIRNKKSKEKNENEHFHCIAFRKDAPQSNWMPIFLGIHSPTRRAQTPRELEMFLFP